MTKIKICGLTRMEDIEEVNGSMPDYVGFVFAKSKRKIDRETAEKLKEKLDSSIQAAGVFVNAEISDIISLCQDNIIDVIQLHGEESEEYIKELKEVLPNQIIKAIRVEKVSQIETAMNCSADYLLLDAYHPHQYGGSGQIFDWNIFQSENFSLKKPYFLAGGIHSGNIEDAIRIGNPYCIDVSSGAETEGLKDPNKIQEIIRKIRNSV